MAGDGELLKVSKSLAKACQLESSILFTGVLSPTRIKDHFLHSMAFVQHSVVAENGDMEGTPVAVLEAQAAGLPVIATWHGGIPDVVIHGKTGLLSAEFDIESMADNMTRILREKGLAKQLGEAGRKRVKENFSMEKHLGILQNEIEKAFTE
jgi:glycosyltransferase involved in cell wall biosynthesis